jgi:Site-specific recombinase XerC
MRFVGATTTEDAAAFLLAGGHVHAQAILANFAKHLLTAQRVTMTGRRTIAPDLTRLPTTVRNRLAAVRSFLKSANTNNVIDWTVEFKPKDHNIPAARPYSKVEGPGAKMLEVIYDHYTNGLDAARASGDSKTATRLARDFAILSLMMFAALRRKEIAGLEITDIDLTDLSSARVNILGKGREHKEWFNVTKEAVMPISEWLTYRSTVEGADRHNNLFISLSTRSDEKGTPLRLNAYNDILAELEITLGLPPGVYLKPHGFRHTAITYAYENYGEQAAIALARHADLATTMRYIDSIRKALASLEAMRGLAEKIARRRPAVMALPISYSP